MPPPQLLILAVLILLGAGFGTWRWLEQRRGDRMRQRAEAMGLTYAAADAKLPAGLQALPLFGRGRRRKVRNHMSGAIADLELRLFDYQYSTGGGKNQSTHRFTVVALRCPGANLPAFALRPEHLGHRIAELAGLGGVLPGGGDIDFDDEPGAETGAEVGREVGARAAQEVGDEFDARFGPERFGPERLGSGADAAAGPVAGPTFSRAYRLTGADEPTIRARFGPAVRAHIEALDGVHVEAAHDWIAVHHGARRAKPERLDALVEEAFGLATAFAPV